MTNEYLKSGLKDGCLPCYEQCRLLGILYPASSNWKNQVIGKEVSDEVAGQYLALKEKSVVNPKLMKKESAVERNMSPEMVLTEDGKHVVITEGWLRSGMTSGVGIKSAQAKALGVNVKKSGWLRAIIGVTIPLETAEEYMRLQYTSAKPLNKKSRKCVLCGSTNVLNVHHKTYEHHGDEVCHIEDLMTVCRDCHKMIHGIK